MKNHAAIILHNNGKVLFVQRAATKKTLPNVWAVPSGTMETGETPDATAVREAKEELQIDVDVKKLLTTVVLPELGVQLHFVVCQPKSDTEVVCDPLEIQQSKWLTFNEFFQMYNDAQIGHGLVYLRKHPEIWQELE